MTFCAQISDETKDVMGRLIDQTEETGNEHGIKLCRIDDKIVNSSRCAGDRCGIELEDYDKLNCPHGSKYIADFHTHPGDDADPSYEDIESTIERGHKYECISSTSRPSQVYCYAIPDKLVKIKDNVDKHEKELSQMVTNFYAMRALKRDAIDKKRREKQSSIDAFDIALDDYLFDYIDQLTCKTSLHPK